MTNLRDTAIRAEFARTWASSQSDEPSDKADRGRQPILVHLGRLIGHYYAPHLARKVARDNQLAKRIKSYISMAREDTSGEENEGNRCAPRISSTQQLTKLIRLLPLPVRDGMTSELADRIRSLFPQKGDAPHQPLGFNYFVSDVVIEHSDGYGAIYYRRESVVEVVFQVELCDQASH